MWPIKHAKSGNADFFKVAETEKILKAKDGSGRSVLITAILAGHLECSKVILGRWPELLYVQDTSEGRTPLTLAAAYGKTEFVKFLIVGAEKRLFRMANTNNCSPLHLAIMGANLDMVKILIEADPDFDSIPANKMGQTPQMLAVLSASGKDKSNIKVQIKDFIIKKIEEKNAIPTRDLGQEAIECATKGDADFFRSALVKECIEARDNNGNSVLSVAVLNGHFECSKVILVRFPHLLYIESTNEKHTPLHHAVWRGIPLIVTLLIVGADKKLFRVPNIAANTPMHMAVLKKRLEIVKTLIKADPDYSKLPANNNGETPLMMAQRLASGKTNDDVAVKIRDLLVGKQTLIEIPEEETTSGVNKLVPTTREQELSIPLKHLDLYRCLVRQFGGIVPLLMNKLEVGPIGNALAGFLSIVAEMQAETPETISEEKLDKWGYAYFVYVGLGLKIDWFSDRIQWFRDWLDRRAKALYPHRDGVERKEKQIELKSAELSDLHAELNMLKAKLENAHSVYSNFDFKIVND